MAKGKNKMSDFVKKVITALGSSRNGELDKEDKEIVMAYLEAVEKMDGMQKIIDNCLDLWISDFCENAIFTYVYFEDDLDSRFYVCNKLTGRAFYTTMI